MVKGGEVYQQKTKLFGENYMATYTPIIDDYGVINTENAVRLVEAVPHTVKSFLIVCVDSVNKRGKSTMLAVIFMLVLAMVTVVVLLCIVFSSAQTKNLMDSARIASLFCQ